MSGIQREKITERAVDDLLGPGLRRFSASAGGMESNSERLAEVVLVRAGWMFYS